jgi:hypothetical protein
MGAVEKKSERRTGKRYPIDAEVMITAPVEAWGHAINVSAHGIRVALNRSLYVGMRCHVRIEASEDNRTQQRARVVWTKPQRDGCILGLEFLPVRTA